MEKNNYSTKNIMEYLAVCPEKSRCCKYFVAVIAAMDGRI
jgi:hypothetical protein